MILGKNTVDNIIIWNIVGFTFQICDCNRPTVQLEALKIKENTNTQYPLFPPCYYKVLSETSRQSHVTMLAKDK